MRSLEENKIINSIYKEFVFGSHLSSLGEVGCIFSVMFLLDKEINIYLLLSVYFSLKIGYYYQLNDTNPERSGFIGEN